MLSDFSFPFWFQVCELFIHDLPLPLTSMYFIYLLCQSATGQCSCSWGVDTIGQCAPQLQDCNCLSCYTEDNSCEATACCPKCSTEPGLLQDGTGECPVSGHP